MMKIKKVSDDEDKKSYMMMKIKKVSDDEDKKSF